MLSFDSDDELTGRLILEDLHKEAVYVKGGGHIALPRTYGSPESARGLVI